MKVNPVVNREDIVARASKMTQNPIDVHRMVPVDGALGELLEKATCTGRHRTSYVNVNGCILPQLYKEFADAIENFEVRDDDIWLCGFPKTGTTWAQEMVWTIANNLDFERGKAPINCRFPYFERSILIEKTEIIERRPEVKSEEDWMDSVSYAKNMPSPRFLKTHLPPDLLPRQLRSGEKKPKVIYVVRNPKDTCISYYHYSKLTNGFKGSFEDCCTLFLADTLIFAPFWKNVLGFWNQRNNYNMLILKYEDMKKDLPSAIRKTAIFLGKNLTNEQVSALTEHLSFSSMKVNPAVNREDIMARLHNLLEVKWPGTFMRSGTTEQWKTVMNPEFIKLFDDWTDQHLNGTGLSL